MVAEQDAPVSITLHRARWVAPVSVSPIHDGAVLIEAVSGEPLIRAVGSYEDVVRDHPKAKEVDHGEEVLLPALVNTHTHLELTALAGVIPQGIDFVGWLEAVSREAAELDEAAALEGIDAGIAECLATGTGLVGDVTDTGRPVMALARSPLRARVFHEVIAFDPRQAEVVFDAARDRLIALENAIDPTAIRQSLAPHAPYTVSSRLLRLIRGFNGQDGRPTSIHLEESPAESEFFQSGGGPFADLKQRLGTTVDGWEAPGQSAVAHLQRIGWFDAPGLAVHGTQLTARGIDILRRAGITVCLCPRSNRSLGVGVAPARELAAAGVPLALGTDSRASTDSLSIFDEMAAAAADFALPPAAILEAATRGGARALGFGDEMGELTPGRRAAVISVSPPAGVKLADPYSLLLGRPGAESIHWITEPRISESRPVGAQETSDV